MTVTEAAAALGVTPFVMKKRITRALPDARQTPAGRRVDLDAGVYAMMYPFAKRWDVFIPKKLLAAAAQLRGAKKRSKP